MNEQMTIWVIVVGIFGVVLIFRMIERMRKETMKDPHFLEIADENDIYIKEKDDELDDFDDL